MRHPDWERRLNDHLNTWRSVECSRARHCGDFAAEGVEAVTGEASLIPIAAARTPRQLAALYRSLGARSLEQVVTALLGQPQHRRAARRGDIVQFAADPALGICLGEMAAGLYHGGLRMLPMQAVSHAWRL